MALESTQGEHAQGRQQSSTVHTSAKPFQDHPTEAQCDFSYIKCSTHDELFCGRSLPLGKDGVPYNRYQ